MTSTTPTPVSRAGHVRVTSHYHNGHTHVERHPPSVLNNEPRRRRVSIYWDDMPRLILVAASHHSKRARAALPQLLTYLQSLPDVLVAADTAVLSLCPPGTPAVRSTTDHDPELARTSYDASEVDLVVCLGGDGLIFHVLHRYFPTRVPPFVPFNMGSLGFLTPFDFASFRQHISSILRGANNTVTVRMRLKCVVQRCEKRTACVHNFEHNVLHDGPARQTEEFHALNEMVIDRGPAPYLSNLEVLADDCPVTRVQADGLIVATPTGSTAYSLSSGGSMVHPNVPAILFTPICPHSLSFRPVLFPDHVTLQIKVPSDSRATAWVSFDGRHRMELMKGDKVIVTVSPWSVPTFSKTDTTNDWFTSVSQCLRWNERVTQGAADSDCEKDGKL
ncbi:putative NAD kinase 2, chloroplastic [Gracilariopsis chorda]|uniref:Putative NAD kinase 2, chloroplastic n=1 Tax=Gracilariopsis chorda TaxID=448386 RepID=A0A2V3IF95_9FLOR|nr:putative NAD kinase 2, chloroplastic [Gracilariopsis chorda]|eukprot:PXF40722.1 putative NAD kinase 2, chloroplastic [Gracilariopsis chorda]